MALLRSEPATIFGAGGARAAVRRQGRHDAARSTPTRAATTTGMIVARLQQTAGNRAVASVLGTPAAVASTPARVRGDEAEREAVRAAQHVASPRRSTGSDVPHPQPSRPSVARPGRTLADGVRAAAESHFGWSFAGVRIHDDPATSESLHRAGARAVTTGEDIGVAAQTGDLEAERNRSLLYHELAHVVQQTRATGRPAPGGAAALLSRAEPGPHYAPVVTAVAAGAELGAGRSMRVTATAAGAGALTWSLVGAPAGVTVTPRGRRGATIRSAPTPLGTAPAGGGTVFQVQAALTATPADQAVSGNITFVSVDTITVNPNPAFIPVPIAGGGTTAAPAGTIDANRGGLTGNTGNVVTVTNPAGRAVTVSLPQAAGASVAGTVITPGGSTGRMRVRVADTATASFNETPLRIDSVPTRVTGLGPAGPTGNPAVYGSINPIRFGQSDNAVPSTRVIGETITAGGSDAFGLTPLINGTGPNPAPVGALSAPANGWNDQLFTGTASVDVNRFVGKNPPGGRLPAVWTLRQGFHAWAWSGAASPVEFDNGVHIRSLIQQGPNFRFRTQHRFPGASVTAPLDPYAAVNPLITLTAITGAANVPAAAGGIAADGVATGTATVTASVAGRPVVWSVVSGPLAIAAGAVVPPAGAAITAGLVAGRFPVKVVDQALPNREGLGRIRIVVVRLRGLTAAPSPVPAGVLSTALALNADPGGRTVNWTVDAAAAAAGVTVVGVPAAAPVATTATLTRPAAFTGTVTVTAVDSVLATKRATLRVRFL
ncbi:eCIS core domain-containing protein [Agromyces sp. ZXT2-6]|uniref:eCIS core domain-containing protein n=1 Tax=Agromyces sp. ZXT2-6 TaxID=3461153 RepID=UPI004054E3B2